MKALVALGMLQIFVQAGSAVDWVRPSPSGGEPRWGIRGRLQFSIPPSWGGPRGLIRILYPTLDGGGYDLVNFIAVEPIVVGSRGFSELEQSKLDGEPGKRIWSEVPSGSIRKLAGGAEELAVDIKVERFDNGAHVWLTAAIRSDDPDEIRFAVHAFPDSKPLDFCILTATMGNKARARLLWLGHGPQRASSLWPGFAGTGFAETRVFPSADMLRTSTGGRQAAITTDESEPAAAEMKPGSEGWAYRGFPVTQYWIKPHGVCDVAVNARASYWGNHRAIPGGPAIENFELRERFRDGSAFVFGVTPRRPRDLGLPGD